ncbi:hypothetical protein [Candidatus Accumulibacter sp. ACC003]|uniref:hypothetical protein n=1 Tax=Candidatus Accumulibacter sp. ACC003 TaxID=2823334 RepID=UPI003450E97C
MFLRLWMIASGGFPVVSRRAAGGPIVRIQQLHRKQPLAGHENKQTSIDHEGLWHGRECDSGTLQQRQADRVEATAQAERHLGDADSAFRTRIRFET